MPDLNHGELAILSPAFESRSPIPERFAADEENLSPPLAWSDVPKGTESLALVCHDPDAPLVDGFTHWVIFDIDAETTELDAGAEKGFRAGLNSLDEPRWSGMAPPPGHGAHHYFFHLFALDTRLDALERPTRRELLDAIEGHVIEQARVVGTYER